MNVMIGKESIHVLKEVRRMNKFSKNLFHSSTTKKETSCLHYEWIIDGKLSTAKDKMLPIDHGRKTVLFLHGLLGNGKVRARQWFTLPFHRCI